MRLLRLLAAALLLVPTAQTARAAQRVLSVPVELPRVQVQAPQLPSVSVLPVVPVLPSVAIPVAPIAPQERAPQGANVSAIAQARSAVPQDDARAPEQTAAAAFDGSISLPRMDALRPYRAGGAQAAITGLTIAGWSLLAGAGLTIATSGAFSSAFVSLGSVVPALIMARPFAKSAPAAADPSPNRRTRALVKRAQRLVEGLVVRAGYAREDAPKVTLSNSEGKDNAWASGALDGKGTIGVGQDYARRSDEELSGVLAHELGHLVHRDSGSSFGQAEPAARFGKFAAAWTLFAAAGALVVHQTWGDAGVALTMTGMGALAAGLGAALVAKASRLVERRADRFGAWLTSTRWMAKGFRRDQRTEKPMDVVDRLYSTHGPAAARVAVLRRDEQKARRDRLPADDRSPVEAQLASLKPLSTWRPPYALTFGERTLKRAALPMLALSLFSPVFINLSVAGPIILATLMYGFVRLLMEKHEKRESTLTAEEQERLIARGSRIAALLMKRLDVPGERAPKVVIDNGHGRGNASIRSRWGWTAAVISLGDDWVKRSNREMAAVLAHEFGHVVHGDGRSPLDDSSDIAHFVTGLSLAPLTTLFVWEYRSFFVDHHVDLGHLPLAVSAAAIGSALAWGGLFAARTASRLRERRADRFAAWLTHPRWLAEFFSRIPDHKPWFKTHPAPSSRVDALIEQATSLGRIPPAGGPKGPGRERGSSLK